MKDMLSLAGGEFSNIMELDNGAQKKVYTAEHDQWGAVAVKIGDSRSNASRERIKREIALLSSVNSSYYPRQFAFHFNQDASRFIIVEEFVEGTQLRGCMQQFGNEKKALVLLRQLFEGLDLIWNNPAGKSVHRDLKPENIIIRTDGTPCILDLGIARLLSETSLTLTVYPHGPCTPNYASPEQLRNEKRNIDHRSDFFSLGIILSELLLGHNPFDPKYIVNSTGSIPENILSGNYLSAVNRTDLSVGTVSLIKKLLKPQPFQRFRTAQSALQSINALI